MVRKVCRDVMFLSKKAEPATGADMQTALDLLDTLAANSEHCVGMAANMIGVNKAIIAVSIGPVNVAMLNPVIIKKGSPYEAEEGCLSLIGTRKTIRYNEIEVEFQDLNLRKQKNKYMGWIAQIIQHECDHLAGTII